jgi:hypothetical protein
VGARANFRGDIPSPDSDGGSREAGKQQDKNSQCLNLKFVAMFRCRAARPARDAHRDVLLLEERIASLQPASNPEGAIARRGAVRAAIAAGDLSRARELAERFSAEAGASDLLKRELNKMIVAATRVVAQEADLAASPDISHYFCAVDRFGR